MLHVAIEKRMESVALKLIAAGCDVSLVDKVGVAVNRFSFLTLFHLCLLFEFSIFVSCRMARRPCTRLCT